MDRTDKPVGELSQDRQAAVNLAVDVADSIAAQSLDFARNEVGHAAQLQNVAIAIAASHMQIAGLVFVANELTAAIREALVDVAGAISETGTNIGAGLSECAQQSQTPNT